MKRFAYLLVLTFCFQTNLLQADQISIEISDPSVVVEVDGAVFFDSDLTISFVADTNDFLIGAGQAGGDIYTNVQFTYNSVELGLVDAVGSELWTLELNGVVDDSITIANVGRRYIGNTGYGGAISSWDGVSDLGPLTGGIESVISGGPSGLPSFDIVNGQTLERFIWNFNDTTITASVIPEPVTLPILAGLTCAGLGRRRRTA